MPINIEIKARVHDFDDLRNRAEMLTDTPCQKIPQEDTFFNCSDGRLKLRQFDPEHGQLVYYQRKDIAGPKHSEYCIFETNNPLGLKEILANAFGVRGVISKLRHLYMVGQTRIHLDEVKGLGQFVELEVVLAPGQTDAEGQEIAFQLMQRLGIKDTDLIDNAYIDLLDQ